MEFLLSKLLREKQIRQEDLADAIGVSRQTISKLCTGKTTSISLDNLRKICKELNCTPNDLFGYNNNESDQQTPKVILYDASENLPQQLKSIGLASIVNANQKSNTDELLQLIDDRINIAFKNRNKKDDTD